MTNKNLYLRAEFDEARARPKAVPPMLELEITFHATTSPYGQSFTLPEDVTGFYLTEVLGSLFWQERPEPGAFEGFVGFGYLSPSMHLSEVREGGDPVNCTLWFALSPSTVSQIEELRRGSKPRFRLEVRVSGYYKRSIKTFNPPIAAAADRGHPVPMEALGEYAVHEQVAVPFHIDRLLMQAPRGNQRYVEIEKSKWVEEILPALGFGAWKVYEIPVGPDISLNKVDEYIEQAVKHFNAGDWKDSMSRSRDAVQALEPYLRKYANEAYTDKRGGSADAKLAALVESFAGLTSSMLDFQSKLFGLLSTGSHPLPAGTTVERPDAEFGLTVAMACRRYVGVRMQTSPVGS